MDDMTDFEFVEYLDDLEYQERFRSKKKRRKL